MADSNVCHLCDHVITSEYSTFECNHHLCSTCSAVAQGRPVCPTCSPAIPASSTPSNYSALVLSVPPGLANFSPGNRKPIFDRLYSENLETCQLKPLLTPKIIENSQSPPFPSKSTPTGTPTSSSSKTDSCEFSTSGSTRSSSNTDVVRANSSEDVFPNDDGHSVQLNNWTNMKQNERMSRDERRLSDDLRQVLVDYVRTLVEHADVFRDRLNSLTVSEAVFDEKVLAAKAEVRRLATEKRRAIDLAEAQLMRKLDSRKAEQMSESFSVRQDLEQNITRMDGLVKRITDTVATCLLDDMVQCFDEVQCDVNHVLESRIGTVNFGGVSYMYTMDDPSSSGNLLGEIEFPPIKEQDDHSAYIFPAPLIQSRDVGGAVIGLAVLGNHLYSLLRENHIIDVHHKRSFEIIGQLDLLYLVKGMLVPLPSDMTACPKTCNLYIADSANSFVYRLDAGGKLLTHWRVENVLGLSVTPTGTVLAGVGCKILEFDSDGRLLMTIKRSCLSKVIGSRRAYSHNTARHVVRSQATDTMFVCDWKDQSSNHTLYQVDDRGQVINHHGLEPGSGDSDLDHPYHVTVAQMDHVIIADYRNNRIKLLDWKMTFVANLVDSKTLKQPTRVCLEETSGRLYVGTEDGRIHVYRITS